MIMILWLWTTDAASQSPQHQRETPKNCTSNWFCSFT